MEIYRDIHCSKANLEKHLDRIKTSSMSELQKDKIHKFVIDLKIGKAGKKVKERRIANYLQFLIKLHNYFKKDLDKITDDEATKFYMDLQENKILKINGMPYAQASKDEFTKTIKRYLGWCGDKNSIEYKKSISWMKEGYKKSDKRAITLQQAESIVIKESNLRNQCLFMFGFDSGGRIEEILNVRIKDLIIGGKENNYFKVHLRGTKTEEADRTIPLPLIIKLLNKWIKEHPFNSRCITVFKSPLF